MGTPATAGSGIGGAVWADVPWLPDADPVLLVKIASNEERVHNLRRSTAGALRAVQHDDIAGSARAIAGIADDLRDAADKLKVTLRRDLILDGLAPAALTMGSVLIAATFAAPVALAGALGAAAAAAAAPGVRARGKARVSAAYAFWRARPPRR